MIGILDDIHYLAIDDAKCHSLGCPLSLTSLAGTTRTVAITSSGLISCIEVAP